MFDANQCPEAYKCYTSMEPFVNWGPALALILLGVAAVILAIGVSYFLYNKINDDA